MTTQGEMPAAWTGVGVLGWCDVVRSIWVRFMPEPMLFILCQSVALWLPGGAEELGLGALWGAPGFVWWHLCFPGWGPNAGQGTSPMQGVEVS